MQPAIGIRGITRQALIDAIGGRTTNDPPAVDAPAIAHEQPLSYSDFFARFLQPNVCKQSTVVRLVQALIARSGQW
jgi:hypothetical protein